MRSLAAFLLLALALPLTAEEKLNFTRVSDKVRLKSVVLDESSGMVVSHRDPSRLWILNDSGGQPALYLTGIDGSDHGVLNIRGATNVDWEDLTHFTLDGKPYLLISDAGDNAGKRPSCTLYIVAEPPLPKDGGMLNATAPIAWSINFVYPGGPRDCESVAVDVPTGKIILISKRTKPPEIYELPLHPSGNGQQTAKQTGTINVPQPAWSFPRPWGTQPTGMAFTDDGTLAAVVTYAGVHLFPRTKGETWEQALGRPASQVLRHSMMQAESVAFSPDGKTLRIVSEGVHSPILSWKRD